jgi:ADP-ribose pyrophosphatase YjhB (NUDIX family)
VKLGFQPPADNQVHTYCLRCLAESVTHSPQARNGKVYTCKSCGHRDSRALIIDPTVVWWVDAHGEYCHETAGVFLKDNSGKFLFFERVKHPKGLTVPAGHVDINELPTNAALRETHEETDLALASVTHVATRDIRGDECRRGADMHKWHIFIAEVPSGVSLIIDPKEGLNPVWLTLNEALCYPLTPAVRHIIRHFARQLA